jgi:hypothetical protein
MITHGICEKCADNLGFQMGVSLEKFLNSLPVPIIAIDNDCRLVNANRPALEMVGMDIFRCRGVLVGEVFECAYARLPGGCGKTIHCNGCVIRNSVRETWQTGRECIKVPAILNHHPTPVNGEPLFLISTKKVNDLVLLKIEDARKVPGSKRPVLKLVKK